MAEEELKRKIEAVLFSAGRMVELEEIAKLCKAEKEKIDESLKDLKQEHDKDDSSLLLIQEGNGWKLTVKEKYVPLVQTVTPHTEINKAILETLAVIAWKQPVMQADVIKMRTSNAYEHIKELVDMGFVSKIKQGRSYVLKTSTRFFDYFDLPGKEAIKEVFKDVKGIEEGQVGTLDVYQQEGEGKAKGEEIKEAEEKMETDKLGELEVFEEKDGNEDTNKETEEYELDENKEKEELEDTDETEEEKEEINEAEKDEDDNDIPPAKKGYSQDEDNEKEDETEDTDETEEENNGRKTKSMVDDLLEEEREEEEKEREAEKEAKKKKKEEKRKLHPELEKFIGPEEMIGQGSEDSEEEKQGSGEEKEE